MNLMKTLVYKNLKLNKKRTIVTIVGIILATALLSALMTLVSSFHYSVIKYQKEKSGDYHYAFSNVSADDFSDFKNNRSIESMFEISQLGFAKLDGCKNEDKPYAYVVSTDKLGFQKGGFKLIDGRFPKNEDEIVIPRHLKTNGRLNYKVGDTITLDIGKRQFITDESIISDNSPYQYENEKLIDTTSKTYKIVGIIERPNYSFEDYSACGYTFITFSDQIQALDAASDKGSSVNSPDSLPEEMTVYARYTQKGLRNRCAVTAAIMGMDEDIFTIMNDSNSGVNTNIRADVYDKYYEQLENAKYGMYENAQLVRYETLYPIDGMFKALIVIAMFVAGIIIFTSVYCIKNSFNISITEKIRQYGMLSSIGATKKQIRKSVKTEAAMLGIVGIPLGTGSGLLAAFILTRVVNALMSEWLELTVVFHTSIIALIAAVLLAIVTIYFSAIGSARKAAKVTPLEAIRNTNEIKIRSKKLKTPRYISKIWGIGGVVSYKNIKRNNKKYRTTVISIIICSVTFIAVSYFMSMAFHLTQMAYSNQSFNISMNGSYKNSLDNEKMAKLVNEIDGVDDYLVATEYYFDVENPDMTKQYSDYFKSYDESTMYTTFAILVLDDKSYADYAKKAGISDDNGTGILINKSNLYIYDEETEKETKAETKLFNYKAGDTLTLGYNVYNASSDTTNIENTTENNTGTEVSESTTEYSTDTESSLEEDDNSIRKTVDITLAGVTDERPLGYESSYGTPIIVMNRKGFDGMWADGECDYDNTPYQEVYVVVEDADKYQDELEKAVNDIDGADYSINNYDKGMREEQSLFTMIGIFAYGLIVVIALIGITNIINTLGTSMELRSREFATLRSIGMTDKQFAKMIRLESLFISAKSLIIGIPIGLVISYIICLMENKMDSVVIYEPPVGAVVMCAVVVILLIYAIMFLSMTKIRNKNIIETIKNENL
ncbi:ABC transporter permease [Agathobacter sp.]